MKVVCDTDVLISGVLFGGHARGILRMALRGAIRNSISPEILREAEEVLLRPKFALGGDQVLNIVTLFRETFDLATPTRRVNAIRTDPADNRILEAALAADASFIISGDGHLLSIKQWRGIEIVSPAQFMREIIGQQAETDGE